MVSVLAIIVFMSTFLGSQARAMSGKNVEESEMFSGCPVKF